MAKSVQRVCIALYLLTASIASIASVRAQDITQATCQLERYHRLQSGTSSKLYAMCLAGPQGSKQSVAAWSEAVGNCALGMEPDKARAILRSVPYFQFNPQPWYIQCDWIWDIAVVAGAFDAPQMQRAKEQREVSLKLNEDNFNKRLAAARGGDGESAYRIYVDAMALARTPYASQWQSKHELRNEMVKLLVKNGQVDGILDYLEWAETQFWNRTATDNFTRSDDIGRREDIDRAYYLIFQHSKDLRTSLKYAQTSTYFAQRFLANGGGGQNAAWGRQAKAAALEAIENALKVGGDRVRPQVEDLRAKLALLDERNYSIGEIILAGLIYWFQREQEHMARMTPAERQAYREEWKRRSEQTQREQAEAMRQYQCGLHRMLPDGATRAAWAGC